MLCPKAVDGNFKIVKEKYHVLRDKHVMIALDMLEVINIVE